MLDGLAVASTYLEVAGLASPAFLIEIEAEAVLA
jgi:enamine deaminase RidA (YjgF/YER057c/UK114 family)